MMNKKKKNPHGGTPSPPPIQPPPTKGNENSPSPDGGNNRYPIQKIELKQAHWTGYVEAACAIALVFITFYYTRAAFRQVTASETAATAAKDAADIAVAQARPIIWLK